MSRILHHQSEIVIMKTSIRVTFFLLLIHFPSLCQGQNSVNKPAVRRILHRYPNEAGGVSVARQSNPFNNPLPASVLLPSGVDSMPIQGTWDFQSNSRALHNVQVDPSNPNNIHAVITAMIDNSGK